MLEAALRCFPCGGSVPHRYATSQVRPVAAVVVLGSGLAIGLATLLEAFAADRRRRRATTPDPDGVAFAVDETHAAVIDNTGAEFADGGDVEPVVESVEAPGAESVEATAGPVDEPVAEPSDPTHESSMPRLQLLVRRAPSRVMPRPGDDEPVDATTRAVDQPVESVDATVGPVDEPPAGAADTVEELVRRWRNRTKRRRSSTARGHLAGGHVLRLQSSPSRWSTMRVGPPTNRSMAILRPPRSQSKVFLQPPMNQLLVSPIPDELPVVPRGQASLHRSS